MLLHTSACIRFANLLLSKTSPLAEPGDRVGGNRKGGVQKGIDTGRPLIRTTNTISLLEMCQKRSYVTTYAITVAVQTRADDLRKASSHSITLVGKQTGRQQEKRQGQEARQSLQPTTALESFPVCSQDQAAEGMSTECALRELGPAAP